MPARHPTSQFMPPAEAAAVSGKRSLGRIAVLSFGVLALAATIATTVVLRQFRSLDEQQQEITHSRMLLDLLTGIRDSLQETISDLGLYGRSGGNFPLRHETLKANISTALQNLDRLASNAGDRSHVQMLEAEFREAFASTDQLITSMRLRPGALAENDAGFVVAINNLASMRNHLNQWRDQHINQIASNNQKAIEALTLARHMSLARIGLATTLIAVLIAIALLTMRRRAQLTEQLHNASQLWHGILSNLDQGVAVYSMDNRLMFWNQRYLQLNGIQQDVLRAGMPIAEVLPLAANLSRTDVDTVLAEAKHMDAPMRGGETRTMTHITEADMALQVTARPMTASYYVVTLTDVTALHRSEAAAVENAARLSAIMDNAPDAIITLDAQGTIETWNAGAERMFGYEPTEILRHGIGVLMANPDFGKSDDCLRRFLGGQSANTAGQRCEFLARHRSGRNFPIDLVINEMRIGTRRRFVGILRDITERRAVDQMKREFIATVSHELRTPLTSISGSLGLLNTNPHNDLTSVTQRLVNIAHKNSERLTRLINDILDLEKGEAGRLRLRLQPLSLYPLIEHAIEANRAYAAGYQVAYTLTGSDPQVPVLADSDRIMQVLTNLMSNAAKFSPPGGRVFISVTVVDGAVRVSVTDQGPGIPEDFHHRVFSRFSQADGSDARPNDGSGLGLAISKSLIEHHGGIIDFESSAQGTTFWFELPIYEEVEPFDDDAGDLAPSSRLSMASGEPQHDRKDPKV